MRSSKGKTICFLGVAGDDDSLEFQKGMVSAAGGKNKIHCRNLGCGLVRMVCQSPLQVLGTLAALSCAFNVRISRNEPRPHWSEPTTAEAFTFRCGTKCRTFPNCFDVKC